MSLQTLNTNGFVQSVAGDPSSMESQLYNDIRAETHETIERRFRLGTLLELFYGLDSDDQAPRSLGMSMPGGTDFLSNGFLDKPLSNSPPMDRQHAECRGSPASSFDASFSSPYQQSAHQLLPVASPMSSYGLSACPPSTPRYDSVPCQEPTYPCFDHLPIKVDPSLNEDWTSGLSLSPFSRSSSFGIEDKGVTAFPNWPDFSGCLPVTENRPQSWMTEGSILWSGSDSSSSEGSASPLSRTLTPFEMAVPFHSPATNVYDLASLQASPSNSLASLSLPLHTFSPPVSRRGSESSRSSKSSSNSPSGKRCSHCKATSTPLWRRDPKTLNTLCNACGLYLQQRNKLRPQELIDADVDEDPSEDELAGNFSGPECSHCHTHRTSVWRRSKTGEQLCNACGVYLRLRGKERPLSLKRNKIKPRTKHTEKTA